MRYRTAISVIVAALLALTSMQVQADPGRGGGAGDRDQGAPNLTDAIWLWGGDAETVEATIRNSRYGMMPGWTGRLSEAEIRQVAVYVHGLGGGE